MTGAPHPHRHRSGDLPDNRRRLFWAMLLTAGFALAEVVGGILSGSLALLSDAGHMITDCGALGLAWFAFRLALKQADLRRSYGYHRFQVLAAFVNGLAMVAIALWIVIEAVRRLLEPVTVIAGPMLAIAILGLAVNIVAFAVLHGGDRRNLNLRGASLHVMGDMMGSIAAITAALVILRTGWMPIDPILSLVVAGLITRSAVAVIRESGHVLLEGTPENVDAAEMRDRLAAEVPEVEDVHHIHIWSLTDDRPVVTLHAAVSPRGSIPMRSSANCMAPWYGFTVSHMRPSKSNRRVVSTRWPHRRIRGPSRFLNSLSANGSCGDRHRCDRKLLQPDGPEHNFGHVRFGVMARSVLRSSVWCSAPGSLDTSLSHAAGLIEIAACHA